MSPSNPDLSLISASQLSHARTDLIAESAEGRSYNQFDQTLALVHDWCPSWRGGERLLSSLVGITGCRDIFTLFDFLDAEIKTAYFQGVNFHTSPVNRWPFIKKYYRSTFPICPFLIEQFNVTAFDAVISSSSAFARGIVTRPDQPHLCYVHTPIRYAWDEQFSYLELSRLGYGPKGLTYRWMLHNLRIWDARTAHGPDLMLANSSYVRARIKQIYGLDARRVFPPVAVHNFTLLDQKDDYFVTASHFAPYKRTDLVIKAFNEMPSRRLIVVGKGQQSQELRKIAGPNISFTGYLPDVTYQETIGRARAFVFAGCEDFGIAMAEAQSAGTPIIAFGRGGATDIVAPLGSSPQPTGVLFKRQTSQSIIESVEYFEANKMAISPSACRNNSMRFAPERFRREILQALDDAKSINARRLTQYPAVTSHQDRYSQ